MTQEKRRSEDTWHLDKRVPIAIIIMVIIQGIIFAYSYGGLSERVASNTRAQAIILETLPKVVRLETLVETMVYSLEEIKTELIKNREDIQDKTGKK